MNIRVRDKNRRKAHLSGLNSLSTDRVRHLTSIAFTAMLLLVAAFPSAAQNKAKKDERPAESATNATPLLWSEPTDIASRDLFYGPGGKAHAPQTTFTFLKEDPKGTSPKFDVRDENGVKWRVKLGPEAKPETVATRLLWSVGYFANEDYFLRDLRVEDMKPLKRGQKLIGADGTMHDVRLKRYLQGEKKVGNWDWHKNPFSGTRELNGLRVMMALINSWDLKDENNSLYERKDEAGRRVFLYMVSDVGGSFGTTGLSFPARRSKGNLPAYSHSKFIKKIGPDYVDFNVPSRPSLWNLVKLKDFNSRMHLRWIGQHIPRADARWVGQLLAQLSPDQIRQAFRAADYSPEQVEEFTSAVEKRIKELNDL